MLLRFIAVMLLGLSALAQAANPPAAVVYERSVTGKINIGTDGRVVAHEFDDKSMRELTPGVRDLVAKELTRWQFEPVLADGHPVIARTRMRMTLEAEQATEGSYRLTVRGLSFGEPKATLKLGPPSYPVDALRIDLGAKVLLVLKLDDQGKVIDAYAQQTGLTKKGRDKVMAYWRKAFEAASLRAARNWQFTPGEIVDGKAVGATIAVPVNFYAGYPPAQRGWSAYVLGPVNPSPWPISAEQLAAAAELQNGESLALDSRFHLKTNAIGSTL